MTDQKKGTPVDFQLLEVRVKDKQAITVTPSGVVTASENSPIDETVLTLSYEKASVEVPVYIYEHGEDTSHGEDYHGGGMSRYEKIARRVTKIHETMKGLGPDMRLIEDELVGSIITKHFLTKFKHIFKNYYDYTDNIPFPEEVHPDFRFRVVKESGNELVMETAILGDAYVLRVKWCG